MSLFQNFNYPNLNNNPANNNNNNQNTNANANANNTQISPQSSIYSNNIEKLKKYFLFTLTFHSYFNNYK